MLFWAVVFLGVALLAGVFCFGGLAGLSAGIAQLVFFIFLALFMVALLARLLRNRH